MHVEDAVGSKANTGCEAVLGLAFKYFYNFVYPWVKRGLYSSNPCMLRRMQLGRLVNVLLTQLVLSPQTNRQLGSIM